MFLVSVKADRNQMVPPFILLYWHVWFRSHQSDSARLLRSTQTPAASHAEGTTAYRCWIQADGICFTLGMWRSRPISAFVWCGFQVQNLSDLDADLSRDQNYQLLAYCGYCNSTYLLKIKQLQTI